MAGRPSEATEGAPPQPHAPYGPQRRRVAARPRRGLEVKPGEALGLLRHVGVREPSAGARAGAVLRRPEDVVLRVGSPAVPRVVHRLQATGRGDTRAPRLLPDRPVRTRRSSDRPPIVADTVPEGRRLEAAIPAREAGGVVGGDGAPVAAGTRAVDGVRTEPGAVLAAQAPGAAGRSPPLAEIAAAEVEPAARPALRPVHAAGAPPVVLVDGEVRAIDARVPSAPHVLPRASPAGPHVATALVLAGHTDQRGAGHAAAAVGGVGRVLQAVRRATAAGPATGLATRVRGVGQGRAARQPVSRGERTRTPGPVGLPTVGDAEAATVGLMYLHGALLP